MYASEETHRPTLAVELVVQFFLNRGALNRLCEYRQPADIKSFAEGIIL